MNKTNPITLVGFQLPQIVYKKAQVNFRKPLSNFITGNFIF
jgi:hypothetical protein